MNSCIFLTSTTYKPIPGITIAPAQRRALHAADQHQGPRPPRLWPKAHRGNSLHQEAWAVSLHPYRGGRSHGPTRNTRYGDFTFTYCIFHIYNYCIITHCIQQLKARRALTLFDDVPLRTRRALSLNKLYGDSALLVLNTTLLNSVNALLVLSQWYCQTRL